MKHEDPKNRMKSLKIVINICVAVLIISLYPQMKKVLNKVKWNKLYYENICWIF